jgi:hypothetical protein
VTPRWAKAIFAHRSFDTQTIQHHGEAMRRMLQRLPLLALVGLFPIACGGPQRGVPLPDSGATLEGTVSYGGQPIKVALIIAQGADRAATNFVGDDGRYHLNNVALGEVNIAVNVAAGRGNLISRSMARAKGKDSAPLPAVIDIPQKYFDPTTSGIKTTINPGPNTFDIVIPK